MKKLFTVLLLSITMMSGAQTKVQRQGNVFIEQKDTTFRNNGTLTKHTYKAKDGKQYPIYLSKNGKAYIVRVSKNTGRQYKQYLPQVTEQLKQK